MIHSTDYSDLEYMVEISYSFQQLQCEFFVHADSWCN